jgi:hypothetical protein
MTDYTKSTNFASKDTLPAGDALKIVKGTEINTEFDNIQTAVATKADLASPALTGTATAVNLTVSGTLTGTLTGSAKSLATTNWTISEISGKLYFKYGSTTVASLDSSGNFIVLADITAYGTP